MLSENVSTEWSLELSSSAVTSLNNSRIVCIVIISILTCVFFIIIIYQIIKLIRWCISRYAWQKSTFSISTSFVNLNLVWSIWVFFQSNSTSERVGSDMIINPPHLLHPPTTNFLGNSRQPRKLIPECNLILTQLKMELTFFFLFQSKGGPEKNAPVPPCPAPSPSTPSPMTVGSPSTTSRSPSTSPTVNASPAAKTAPVDTQIRLKEKIQFLV